MSNPQINTLSNQGTLKDVQDDIVDILVKYSSDDKPLCSHEILGLANATTIKAIADGINPSSGGTINAGGYSIPSSWIGSVAADMAKNQRIIPKNKKCTFNEHDDEAWYIL
ncbi:hypothetical protein EAL2_c19680 [Peptoclostridium acidaminophilum DSM 3953]|uniref:Uncharacterized protein n=1 Tax=Peptoclostridium acidaminophilum DSM 3953 TaxID=1286171 RepID=W8T679_PEPAC|nr:hypothetical protein [Peptoclostridium acidaminophilum]AHM57249.1 hypothetical protein EAL2_c19680 [Peptoclostridium acidaminophilum DSM 3953]